MRIVRFDQLDYGELISIEQKSIDSKDRPEVSNKFRKLIFFILREGIYRTLSKINSKSNKELFLTKKHTLITICKNGNLYVNYSTQTTDDHKNFVINNIFHQIKEQVTIDIIKDKGVFNQFVCNSKHNNFISLNDTVTWQVSQTTRSNKGIFIYGLGDYSRVYVAPNISGQRKSFCIDYNYALSSYYKKKFNYENFGLVPEDSYPKLKNTDKPLAIIATYHSDHTRIAKEIFDINPLTIIFIEKPPCVTLDDIKVLSRLFDQGAKIEIGYNRRFIPVNRKVKELIYNEQKVINISVKEILINDNHWYFWTNQGTRITGNLTHWIDLSVFWINGSPIEINLISSPTRDETIALSILFSEGSLVNITVSDKGNSMRGVQEYIEIRTKNETFFIEDYTKFMRIKPNGNKQTKRFLKRIKGHDAMYKHVIQLYEDNDIIQYTKEDLIYTSMTTFYASEMYKNKVRSLKIDDKIKDILH